MSGGSCFLFCSFVKDKEPKAKMLYHEDNKILPEYNIHEKILRKKMCKVSKLH